MSNSQTKPFLTDRSYNALKWIAQVFLPALATLYFTLSQIWGLPNGEQVVGTITAFDLFLGLLLGISTKRYNNSDAKYDGSIDIEETDESKLFSLNLDSDPEKLGEKNEVLFKVNHDAGELAP